MILVPGQSIVKQEKKIQNYIWEKKPIVISVNFDAKGFDVDFEFYGNIRRYEKVGLLSKRNKIVSSNIKVGEEEAMIFNYFELIEPNGKYFDNSTIMLLNLLKRVDAKNITFAGFDGFSSGGHDFVDDTFYENRFLEKYAEINTEMEKTLRNFAERVSDKMKIKFLTSSIYEKIFE